MPSWFKLYPQLANAPFVGFQFTAAALTFRAVLCFFDSYFGPDYYLEHTITETDGWGAEKYFWLRERIVSTALQLASSIPYFKRDLSRLK
jgi:hypothetical protein